MKQNLIIIHSIADLVKDRMAVFALFFACIHAAKLQSRRMSVNPLQSRAFVRTLIEKSVKGSLTYAPATSAMQIASKATASMCAQSVIGKC